MRILVVEDEQRIANTIKKGLEQERYAVDVAYDGESGYDLAMLEEYDCIVLDVMLPKMNGVQICAMLRKNAIHIPILMLTAKSQTEDVVMGLNNGADDYLTKPFSFDELVARIKALSRRPHKTQPLILSSGSITLNTQKYTVLNNKKIIPLSKKEFAVLEYLLKNKGTVLSKEQITTHVWDYDADILPNTVEVTIANIRKKMGEKGTMTFIRSIRGFGYSIDN